MVVDLTASREHMALSFALVFATQLVVEQRRCRNGLELCVLMRP